MPVVYQLTSEMLIRHGAVASARRKAQRKAHRIAAERADPGRPTKQRLLKNNSPVERVDRIVDDEGRAASPYRAKAPLLLLFQRGVVDSVQFNAGTGFNQKFRAACLDQLHAQDLLRGHNTYVAGGGSAISERIEAARDFCWSRITAVGGLATLPGSLLWAVVGLEASLHA
jgi:hypothetical protein